MFLPKYETRNIYRQVNGVACGLGHPEIIAWQRCIRYSGTTCSGLYRNWMPIILTYSGGTNPPTSPWTPQYVILSEAIKNKNSIQNERWTAQMANDDRAVCL